MTIRPAGARDVAAASACFAAAFRQDPLITHFFEDHPAGWEAAATFFRLLLQARLAMGMPALVACEGERLQGGAMGYHAVPGEWPADLQAQWLELESASPAIAGRFDAYEQVSSRHTPRDPHYYLGVIGVDPALRGTGLGGRLLRAFCGLSDADPASTGVYLETGQPGNVGFYSRHGFEVRGTGSLGALDLVCMFRPRGGGRE